MYNQVEFEVQMKRAGYTQASLAKEMGICLSTLNNKAQNGSFKRDEIANLIKILKIDSPDRLYEIFFADNLRSLQT